MNVPKLRLPEFWDAGEWEEKKLGSFVEIFLWLCAKYSQIEQRSRLSICESF